jgi:glutamate racemase
MASGPIGLFDSGVGGLSIVREVRRLLPQEDLWFVGDQGHVPYGPRSLDEVRAFSRSITQFLLSQGACLVVVACNTASAAALQSLRHEFPGIPFVGMEPAVKPAAETSSSGVVGVLATPATFQGALFASVVERFATGVRVLQQTVPGLVERIEAGDLDGDETRRLLEGAVRPLLAQGADTIVLACTHYPFVIPLLRSIVGDAVQVIDPSPAIARQVKRVLTERAGEPGSARGGQAVIGTTGDADRLRRWVDQTLGDFGRVVPLRWQGNELVGEEGIRES